MIKEDKRQEFEEFVSKQRTILLDDLDRIITRTINKISELSE